jgi:uncharacterized HAD superfamily protein
MGAVSFDIDGTLSLGGKPNRPLISLLRKLNKIGYKIFIVTARPEREKERTVKWLRENAIPYDTLRMRPNSDNSPDEDLRVKQVVGSMLHFDDKPRNCDKVSASIPCVRV